MKYDDIKIGDILISDKDGLGEGREFLVIVNKKVADKKHSELNIIDGPTLDIYDDYSHSDNFISMAFFNGFDYNDDDHLTDQYIIPEFKKASESTLENKKKLVEIIMDGINRS